MRDTLLTEARYTVKDLPLLRERAESGMAAWCTRKVCFEPEVRELAAIIVVLLDMLEAETSAAA